LLKVKDIIEGIAGTSSRKDKESILNINKDNQLLRDVLYFVYNTYIITGLSNKKMNKVVNMEGVRDIDDVMEYLKENNTGSDLDIQIVQKYISNQSVELQDLYKQIVTKNLKIGITANTINKVFGNGFIPKFEVMLASKYQDHEHKITKFIITEKLDGCRCVLLKDNDKITLMSRQGQLIEGLIEIENTAKLLPDNIVLDGELVLKNLDNLNSADLFRETMKVVRKDGIKRNVAFNAFDMLPIDEFKVGKSKLGAGDRKKILHQTLALSHFGNIRKVEPLYIGEDKDKVAELLDKMEKLGKEGVMVNSYDGKYECKRSRDLLKVKTMNVVDLEIIGFEEGSNKYKGKLGRINVSYKGFKVGVGSGFSDNERLEIWLNQNEYLGRICEIQYFEESKNQKDDSLSLRFPVWKRLREAGKEISYN